MAGQGKLGIYWSSDGLSFIEVLRDAAVHKSYLAFSAIEDDPEKRIPASLLQDSRLLEHIQRTVRNNAFTSTDIYFSIPSKDIIVRWFVIPWIRPYEIQGVVAFEARKYIPFPLEDLTYTYYPSTFVQGGVKQIGVVFVGIRKEMFHSYLRVFVQSGLNVVYCEPSSMSLMRALVHKKLVDPTQNVAILQVNNHSGEISIGSNGFVKFIRDFSLSSGSSKPFNETADFLKAKLYNEVRISLDFFGRQHSEDASKMVILSSAANKGLADGIISEIGLPVLPVDAHMVMGTVEQDDIGAVGAYGVTLSGEVPTVIDFNISEGEVTAAVRRTDASQPKVPHYIWPALSAVVSILIIGFTWFMNSQQLSKINSELAVLKKDLGEFSEVPLEDIDSKNTKVKKFTASVKDLALRSSFTPIMVQLVALMPKGMWIDSFSLTEKALSEAAIKSKGKGKAPTPATSGKDKSSPAAKTQLVLNISGYLFLNDTNAEFDTISQFVITLRSDSAISQIFKDIKLMNMKAQDMEGRSVTAFSIAFQ